MTDAIDLCLLTEVKVINKIKTHQKPNKMKILDGKKNLRANQTRNCGGSETN